MKKLLLLAAAVLAVGSLSACSRATSNTQTVWTSDCGQNWRKIETGQAVPAAITPCDLKVTMPNYPMNGEVKFRTTFDKRALAYSELTYVYQIDDAKKFIMGAKYLGKQNLAPDANDGDKYEQAENMIIDSVLRDIATEELAKVSIIDFNQATYEPAFLETVNKRLAARGVSIQTLTFNVVPDDQTRQAIDVVSARNVYDSFGLGELGDKIMVARAGASRVSVTAPTAQEEK